MKQTAVEWLEDYIQKEINKYSHAPMDLSAIIALRHIKDFAIEKAKQMEKEQIEDAYYYGADEFYPVIDTEKKVKSEQYYNETYGKCGTK